MAITNTFVDEFVWNKLYIRIYDITLDSSYPTNGYTAALGFAAKNYRLKTILGLEQIGVAAAAGLAADVRFDTVNTKLLAEVANVQVANATDLHLVKVRVMIFGR